MIWVQKPRESDLGFAAITNKYLPSDQRNPDADLANRCAMTARWIMKLAHALPRTCGEILWYALVENGGIAELWQPCQWRPISCPCQGCEANVTILLIWNCCVNESQTYVKPAETRYHASEARLRRMLLFFAKRMIWKSEHAWFFETYIRLIVGHFLISIFIGLKRFWLKEGDRVDIILKAHHEFKNEIDDREQFEKKFNEKLLKVILYLENIK